MRQLEPVIRSVKATVNDVVDFLFGSDYSVKQHLLGTDFIQFISESAEHGYSSVMKRFQFDKEQMAVLFCLFAFGDNPECEIF